MTVVGSRKTSLLAATCAFSLLAVCWCAAIFTGSLAPSQKAINDAEFHIGIPAQLPGELQVIPSGSQTFWWGEIFVFLPTPEQMKQLVAITPYVHDSESQALRTASGAFVFWGYDTRWGRKLAYVPAGGTYHSRWWNQDAPDRWQGGFWNDSEVSYDYSGRSISDRKHTFNSYTVKVPNLGARHIEVEGDRLVVKLL